MQLVESRTDSGLVVVEQSTDGAAVGRALRQHDSSLELQQWPHPSGQWLYKVVARTGDGPPHTVYVHQAHDGTPLPLSSRIVDEVRLLDRNSRRPHADEDELDRQHRAQLARDEERDRDALIDDWDFKHGRAVLPRGTSLRMARDKRRARGEKC